MAKKTFYITTAIDYPSGKPHLGHAYEKICADVLARWHRLRDEDVFFLTGTDEHGKKIQTKAEESGLAPKQYVDQMVKFFKELCKELNISHDRFIRTTDKDHEKVSQMLFENAHRKGEIYKGFYEGKYCVDCETYYTDRELESGCCPVHKKKVETLKEESYFFKIGKYEKQIIDFHKKNKVSILPLFRKNEIQNRLKEGLIDLSVSRTSFKWGVPVSFDKKHVVYVWFDALINYLSGINYPKKGYEKYWDNVVHITGKDILWHHTAIWDSILLSAGIKPPKTVFAHGFINIAGEKMSKSRGTVVDPLELSKKYGADTLRYFFMREIPFGDDGNFSEEALINRHNNELANDLGNLLNRTTNMLNKYFKGQVPKGKNELINKLEFEKIDTAIENLDINSALSEIWKFINHCNKYTNDNKPWELAVKDEKKLSQVLYTLADSLRVIALLVQPFMPETSFKIGRQLGIKNFEKQTFKDIQKSPLKNEKIKKPEILFSKIEMNPEPKEEVKEIPKGGEHTGWIEFKDWEKLDFRVGTITKIQPHPEADKLYVILVDLGPNEQDRQIVAGLKKYYKPEELLGKKIIVFINLKPVVLRGIESNGMLLAAEDDKGNVSVLTLDKEVNNNAKIC